MSTGVHRCGKCKRELRSAREARRAAERLLIELQGRATKTDVLNFMHGRERLGRCDRCEFADPRQEQRNAAIAAGDGAAKRAALQRQQPRRAVRDLIACAVQKVVSK